MKVQHWSCSSPTQSSKENHALSQSPPGFYTKREDAERPPREGLIYDAMTAEWLIKVLHYSMMFDGTRM